MRFTLGKSYSLTVYDKDVNYIYHACGLRFFKSKTSVLKWAAWAAKRERRTFGHVSVGDDETSQIVRYTPSGRIWG